MFATVAEAAIKVLETLGGMDILSVQMGQNMATGKVDASVRTGSVFATIFSLQETCDA